MAVVTTSEKVRQELQARLRRIWWVGAAALLAVAATAVGMHLAQTRSQDRVLQTREILRTARQALALTTDRAAAMVIARFNAEELAVGRERQVRVTLVAKMDTLVMEVAEPLEQREHALALQQAVRRWVGDTAMAPALSENERAAVVREVAPTFQAIRTAFDEFIEAEDALYAASVRRYTIVSRLGLGAILLEVVLLIGILGWFRDRATTQAGELMHQQDRLEEQAMELELQVDESRDLARAIEMSNRELVDRERAERAAHQAMATAERRYRTLIEQSLDLIAILDSEGRFTYISGTVERVLGYPAAELTETNGFDLIHPDDVDATRVAFARLLNTGHAVTVEYRCRHRNGSWRRLSSIATNLLLDDSIAGVVVNTRDVTDERQLEEQLHQAQKMEAVGRLAGGIAHDFNNLLTSIKLNCQLLEQLLDSDRTEREEVLEIAKAVDRATALTNQLLAFGRKQILQPRVLDLNESVRDVERMLRRLLGEDIELHTELDPALPTVLADPGQVQQVLVNLAVNSGDAMPHGGRLSLATGVVELDAESQLRAEVAPGRYVMLAVSDTGIGMDEQTQARMFEPFFTTKPPGKGTGLGLSTVYGIMKQSGGHVWVYSEKGSGTVFKLLFPAKGGVVAPDDALASSRPGGSETVLVVEDEPHLRPLVTRVLREHGYTVLEASNGREALALCGENGRVIDLVITDVVMPEMSGREFSERLSEMELDARLLYMSGYTDDEILRRGVLDPGVAFLQKPFAAETLLHAVRRVLDARSDGVGASS